MFEQAIINYLTKYSYSSISLRSVLFDMDGVLFNSMPYHSEAWHLTMKNHGLTLSREEAYLHEGRTGAGTINLIFQRELGRDATEEEIQQIYTEKSFEFNKFPSPDIMPGSWEVIQKIKKVHLLPILVTGSGQKSLLNKLNTHFPETFYSDFMVTAYDVKYGKPNPEPYMMGLKKGNLKANEAIVIENAPLGVEAGVAAGIFTIAVNTGPINEEILLGKGANILFPSMEDFCNNWEELYKAFNKIKIKM